MNGLGLKSKAIAILVLFFGFSVFVNAQDVGCSIRIKVIDQSTQAAVEDADIRVINYEKKTIHYASLTEPAVVEFLPSGKYSVAVFIAPESFIYKKIDFECDKSKEANPPELVIVEHGKETGKRLGVMRGKAPDNPEIDPGKVVNGSAIKLAIPGYPPAARGVRVSGTVEVSVVIDTEGSVVAARAISGHPLLKRGSEKAAVESMFKVTRVDGEAVEVSGIIVYNFKP
ncbi:MAG: energy transducer TonB [Acidobacteria bacterium]|nr:energy transducer TonB [Acidobacteriota bacterium]